MQQFEEKEMQGALLKLYAKLRNLENHEEGQDLVEYALLVAVIAIVCIAALKALGSVLNSIFTNISNSLA